MTVPQTFDNLLMQRIRNLGTRRTAVISKRVRAGYAVKYEDDGNIEVIPFNELDKYWTIRHD